MPELVRFQSKVCRSVTVIPDVVMAPRDLVGVRVES